MREFYLYSLGTCIQTETYLQGEDTVYQTGLFLWQWALRYSHTSVGSFLCAPVLEDCTVLEVLVSKHWSLQPFEWQDLGFPFHLWLEQAHPSLLCALIPEAGRTVTTGQNLAWPEAQFFAQKALGLLPDSLALFSPGKGISPCKNKQRLFSS